MFVPFDVCKKRIKIRSVFVDQLESFFWADSFDSGVEVCANEDAVIAMTRDRLRNILMYIKGIFDKRCESTE